MISIDMKNFTFTRLLWVRFAAIFFVFTIFVFGFGYVSAYTFTQYLQRGSFGSEVTQLQLVLKSDPTLYPEGLVTGYFGVLTERAVQRFQIRYNIVTSGTPDPAGFGVVGPLTRAKLNEVYQDFSGASSGGGVSVPVLNSSEQTPLQSGSAGIATSSTEALPLPPVVPSQPVSSPFSILFQPPSVDTILSISPASSAIHSGSIVLLRAVYGSKRLCLFVVCVSLLSPTVEAKWSSDNTDVATVSYALTPCPQSLQRRGVLASCYRYGQAILKGIAPGTAHIHAEYGFSQASSVVTVTY